MTQTMGPGRTIVNIMEYTSLQEDLKWVGNEPPPARMAHQIISPLQSEAEKRVLWRIYWKKAGTTTHESLEHTIRDHEPRFRRI